MIKNVTIVSPYICCSHCNRPNTISVDFFESFFSHVSEKCGGCGSVINDYNTIHYQLTLNLLNNNPFYLIYAQSSIIQIGLESEKPFKLDLIHCGISHEAKIIYINYTPTGDLFPLEMHGNVPIRNTINHSINLYPINLSKSEAKTGSVNIMVSWLSVKDEIYLSMLEALEYFVVKKYTSMIIPLHTCMEALLDRYLVKYLKVNFNKEVKNLNYYNKLHFLLPMSLEKDALSLIKEAILNLDELRDRRNKLVHSKNVKSLEDNVCARLLASSIFIFYFLLARIKSLC